MEELVQVTPSLSGKESSPGTRVLSLRLCPCPVMASRQGAMCHAYLILMIMAKLMNPSVLLKYKFLKYHTILVLSKITSLLTMLLMKILSRAQLRCKSESPEVKEGGAMTNH